MILVAYLSVKSIRISGRIMQAVDFEPPPTLRLINLTEEHCVMTYPHLTLAPKIREDRSKESRPNHPPPSLTRSWASFEDGEQSLST